MKRIRGYGRCTAVCLSMLLIGAFVAPASANLLTNPGFEDGATGSIGDTPVPGWNAWGWSGWLHNDAGRVIDTQALKFWWDDSGMWQDFAAVAGQEYDYSVQAFNSTLETLVDWNGLIKAEFYNSAIGTNPGDALLEVELDKFYSATDPVDQWVEIGGSVTAPAGADIGRIVLLIVDWSDVASGAMNFDDAVVTPEPASAVALVALALIATRRR